MKRVITVLVGLIMIAGAFGHVFSPETYVAMIPAFIPSAPANILAAIIEFIIGLALLHPTYSKYGGLGFAALMIAFIPIHVFDLFRDHPRSRKQGYCNWPTGYPICVDLYWLVDL